MYEWVEYLKADTSASALLLLQGSITMMVMLMIRINEVGDFVERCIYLLVFFNVLLCLG